MTKNHLKEKDFCYINIENDLYYNLCYPTRVNLKKLKKHETIEYVNTNYLYNENRVLNNLLKDLIIFKTYRDEIEKEIKNEGIAREIIIFFISVISAILSLKAINKEHLSNEQVNIVFFALIIYIFLKVAIELFATSKNSDSSRLIVVNYAIYTLESIKEENYHNQDYSEEKKDDNQEIKPDEQEIETVDQETVVTDSKASETKISYKNIDSNKKSSISHDLSIALDEGKTRFSAQDRHYQVSYPLAIKTLSNGTQIEDLVKYVTDNYINRDFFDRDKLINDLIMFKSMKFDLELDIKNNEKFFSGIPILKCLDTDKVRNDKWSINNRIKTINNIILVLEAIKEEIDTKKKD